MIASTAGRAAGSDGAPGGEDAVHGHGTGGGVAGPDLVPGLDTRPASIACRRDHVSCPVLLATPAGEAAGGDGYPGGQGAVDGAVVGGAGAGAHIAPPGLLPALLALLASIARRSGDVPPPGQGTLQLVLGSQGDRMQSTGQPAVLQALMSTILSSHARPPLLAGVTTVRIQVCSPPPQVTLHVVTGLQEDRTQSTGQPAVLQLLTSSLLLAHARPPLLAGVTTYRYQV